MEKTLVVSSEGKLVKIALLQDGKLLELHSEEQNKEFVVGDIFLGKIKKLSPGLNSAFVNIGSSKDAFLHYHDLGPKINSLDKYVRFAQSGKKKGVFDFNRFKFLGDIDKNDKITNVLKKDQQILVQIIKEPISTKGPRISSEISLPGRFLVLIPFSDRVSISQKITTKAEKSRLKNLIHKIKPKGFGVIVRTASEKRTLDELQSDIDNLVLKWDKMFQKVSKKSAPERVHVEANRASTILRDLFDNNFNKIICDDVELCSELEEYIQLIAPKKSNIVEYYDRAIPVMESYNIEKQVKSAFGKTVNASKGVYLVIEHTEAMHVVDVNSGNTNKFKESQEQAALEVNLIAATELARQLRLRDMGGIVVVDFIDMRKAENRKLLIDHLRDAMSSDKAKHKILPPTKFGLVQITRQRVRPSLKIKTKEENPSTPQEVEAPILLINKIENELVEIWKKNKKVNLHIHPFIASYLTKGLISTQLKWTLKYKRMFKIIPRHAYNYLEYHYFDAEKKEIEF